MKSLLLFAVALSLSFTTGLYVGGTSHRPDTRAIGTSQALDPAFRDGLYQGKLDARDAKHPHLSTGRWSTDADRASYIAGYQQGFGESVASHSALLTEPSIAQLAASGYRDGTLDGAWHRLASQPFQADQTPHYRDAGLSTLKISTNQEIFQRFYREAYLHGYQQAYYSQPK